VWILASLLFALYLATVASYSKTYGPLGGFTAFLVWLWLTNLAVRLGAEFNTELERSQQRAAGEEAPEDEQPSAARAERLIELAELTRPLGLVVRADAIPVWLNRPVMALDNENRSN
jgi:Virulence factor BrkB